MTMRLRLLPAGLITALLWLGAGCGGSGNSGSILQAGNPADTHDRLPTGARLDPAAPLHLIGQMPLAMVSAPGSNRVVLLMNGWRGEGIQVADPATGRVLQTIPLPGAFR